MTPRSARAAAYLLSSGWKTTIGRDCLKLSHANRELSDTDGMPPPTSPEELREAAQSLLEQADVLELLDNSLLPPF